MRRRILWFLAAGVVVLGGAGFLWWQARSQRPQYVTAAVTRGNVRRSVSMTGALNPVVTVQVGSYVSGPVKTLHCDFNTEVVVGQICATIDPLPFQLIVDQDRAEVGTAEAQLKKDRAAQVYAKIAFERDSKLLAEGTVSQDTVDNDKSAYDQITAQIGLDQATIVNKEATLKAAEVNLAYTNIVSPVVGTVITRSVDVGQTVAASLQSPTLFIIGKDLTRMQVDTNVSESDVGAVRIGQDAIFTVQAFPGRSFRGKVTQIRHGPITVQNVVTYDAVVAVDNPERLLFPGMTADTRIVIDEHDGVLRVPLPAVRFNPEGIAGAGEAPPARDSGRPEEKGEDQSGTRVADTGGGGAGRRGAGGKGGGDGSPGAGNESGGPSTGGMGSEGGRRHPGEGRRARGGEAGTEARGRDAAAGRLGRRGEGSPWGSPEGETGGGPGGGPAGGAAGSREGRAGGGREAWTGGARDGRAGGGREGRTGRGGRTGGSAGEHRSRVWVLNDGKLRPVLVTTGLDDGTLIEVFAKDLKPGDKVVVNEIKPGEQRQRGQAPNPNQAFRQQGGGPRL
ncbi:MAG TPA: efflux RND transporter periplasmic adaptor subunit [Thermoanaerobaculia bacterium]|nr:efflux RND transporter periplasmic adaptor subunit [Thermoanaerobaculia bacterium]